MRRLAGASQGTVARRSVHPDNQATNRHISGSSTTLWTHLVALLHGTAEGVATSDVTELDGVVLAARFTCALDVGVHFAWHVRATRADPDEVGGRPPNGDEPGVQFAALVTTPLLTTMASVWRRQRRLTSMLEDATTTAEQRRVLGGDDDHAPMVGAHWWRLTNLLQTSNAAIMSLFGDAHFRRYHAAEQAANVVVAGDVDHEDDEAPLDTSAHTSPSLPPTDDEADDQGAPSTTDLSATASSAQPSPPACKKSKRKLRL